jgi:hypothetical protein
MWATRPALYEGSYDANYVFADKGWAVLLEKYASNFVGLLGVPGPRTGRCYAKER